MVRIRSSRPEVLCKKVFLKVLQISQKNTCTSASFLITLQASGLQLYEKRDSGTCVFLWILRHFLEQLFYRTPLDDCTFLVTTLVAKNLFLSFSVHYTFTKHTQNRIVQVLVRITIVKYGFWKYNYFLRIESKTIANFLFLC